MNVELPKTCTVCKKDNPAIPDNIKHLLDGLRPGEGTLVHVCECGWREWFCRPTEIKNDDD